MGKPTYKNRKKGFSPISNCFLRDETLSPVAYALGTLLFFLPDDWDCSAQGLAVIRKWTLYTVNKGLRELEEKGYLRRRQLRVNGRFAKRGQGGATFWELSEDGSLRDEAPEKGRPVSDEKSAMSQAVATDIEPEPEQAPRIEDHKDETQKDTIEDIMVVTDVPLALRQEIAASAKQRAERIRSSNSFGDLLKSSLPAMKSPAPRASAAAESPSPSASSKPVKGGAGKPLSCADDDNASLREGFNRIRNAYANRNYQADGWTAYKDLIGRGYSAEEILEAYSAFDKEQQRAGQSRRFYPRLDKWLNWDIEAYAKHYLTKLREKKKPRHGRVKSEDDRWLDFLAADAQGMEMSSRINSLQSKKIIAALSHGEGLTAAESTELDGLHGKVDERFRTWSTRLKSIPHSDSAKETGVPRADIETERADRKWS